MKTIYKCSQCDKEFEVKEECICHEIGIHALDENLKGIDVLIAIKNICLRYAKCPDTCPFINGNDCILDAKPKFWKGITGRYNLERLKD